MAPITTPVSANPAGLAFGRTALALGLHNADDRTSAVQMAAVRWKDQPQVSRALELGYKAVVGPIHSEDWQSPLVPTGIAADALAVLRGLSFVDQLSGRMRRVPFLAPLQPLATNPVGTFVAEGRGVAAHAFTLSHAITVTPATAAVIIVVSNQLLRARDETSVSLYLRDLLLGGLAHYIDRQFIDPANGGAHGHPASVVNDGGGTVIVSTGNTASAITTNMQAMVAAIDSPGRGLTWILSPQTAAHISLALGAAVDLPRSMAGLPVTISAHASGLLALVDLDAVAIADAGDLDIERAESASVQLSDSPTQSALSVGSPLDDPTPTTMTSLFQVNAVGFKPQRTVAWKPLVANMSAAMVVDY